MRWGIVPSRLGLLLLAGGLRPSVSRRRARLCRRGRPDTYSDGDIDSMTAWIRKAALKMEVWLGFAGFREEGGDKKRGRKGPVPARRQGASHGGASVVLEEEKWTGGLSSVWGASESEEGCVWVYAKSLESMLNRGGSGVRGREQQYSSLTGQNGRRTG
jgi:hypothetical protein